MVDTIISIISVFISFVAVIVSIFSGRKTRQLDLKLKQMELSSKEKESEESKKAEVEVNKVETATKQPNKLRFYNKGKQRQETSVLLFLQMMKQMASNYSCSMISYLTQNCSLNNHLIYPS